MRRWRTILIVIFILIFSFFIYPIIIPGPIKNTFNNSVKPISSIARSSFSGFFNLFDRLFNLKRIVYQNSSLIKENLELQSKIAKLSEIQSENEILKKELGFFKKEKTEEMISSAIILNSSSGYLKSLTIDHGLSSGVAVGQAVVSQGFLVGKISQVRENSAEVTLITDFNSLVPVNLQESSGTGLLRGGLAGLIIEDIPLNTEVKIGEIVTTSSLDEKIPAGIAVGKVVSIVSKKGEIFQRVSVTSLIDFSNLKVLFVVKT